MLGYEQMQWLQDSLSASAATWKVIVSSVPISVPTGANGRDGWANFDESTGFESEMWKLLRFMQTNSVNNVLFITTDIHFGTGFRYRPFPEHADFEFYEFVSGPLNAGAYLRKEYDTTFGPERLYLYGSDSIKTFDAAIRWFNYGELEVDKDQSMHMRLINGLGEVVFSTVLKPVTRN